MIGKSLPVGLAGGERRFLANQEARLLVGFPDRRERNGAGARQAGAPGAGPEFCLLVRVEAGGDGDAAVGRIGAAAREDEFSGHEGMPHVATSHQYVECAALMVEDNEGRRIARPQRAGA